LPSSSTRVHATSSTYLPFLSNPPPPPPIYTLSLHDALPISASQPEVPPATQDDRPPCADAPRAPRHRRGSPHEPAQGTRARPRPDRKSTRLNSSHLGISYAVFCLKKKRNQKSKDNVKPMT